MIKFTLASMAIAALTVGLFGAERVLCHAEAEILAPSDSSAQKPKAQLANAATDACCIVNLKTKQPATPSAAKIKSADPPFACSLSAATLASRKSDIATLFSSAVVGATEVDKGFTLTFKNGYTAEIISFVEKERKCCKFFDFTMHFPNSDKPVTLTIVGPEGTKQLVSQMLENVNLES